jgi:uncharacterized OB-fold protein
MTTFLTPGLPTTPRPTIDPETEEYWSAAGEGRLVLPFCVDCARPFWYPRGFCPRCGGSHLDWRPASGDGVIYSFSVVRRPFGAWRDHAPFVVALVTLDEGVTVSTNIVGMPLNEVEIGTRVAAIFEKNADDDLPVLRFIPRANDLPE